MRWESPLRPATSPSASRKPRWPNLKSYINPDHRKTARHRRAIHRAAARNRTRHDGARSVRRPRQQDRPSHRRRRARHRRRPLPAPPGRSPRRKPPAWSSTPPSRFPSPTLFDRILIDAPCSGTGTLARNPEIKWRLEPSDLPVFQARQRKMIEQALPHLRPGGRLVYATCSLEQEENEGGCRTDLPVIETHIAHPGPGPGGWLFRRRDKIGVCFSAGFLASTMTEILPSILSADFACLGEQVAALEQAGCRISARRRHGWPLRSQSHHRAAGGGVAAQGHAPDAGRPPDDYRSRPLRAPLHRGRRESRLGASGNLPALGPHPENDPRPGSARWRGHQSGDAAWQRSTKCWGSSISFWS